MATQKGTCESSKFHYFWAMHYSTGRPCHNEWSRFDPLQPTKKNKQKSRRIERNKEQQRKKKQRRNKKQQTCQMMNINQKKRNLVDSVCNFMYLSNFV